MYCTSLHVFTNFGSNVMKMYNLWNSKWKSQIKKKFKEISIFFEVKEEV